MYSQGKKKYKTTIIMICIYFSLFIEVVHIIGTMNLSGNYVEKDKNPLFILFVIIPVNPCNIPICEVVCFSFHR